MVGWLVVVDGRIAIEHVYTWTRGSTCTYRYTTTGIPIAIPVLIASSMLLQYSKYCMVLQYCIAILSKLQKLMSRYMYCNRLYGTGLPVPVHVLQKTKN